MSRKPSLASSTTLPLEHQILAILPALASRAVTTKIAAVALAHADAHAHHPGGPVLVVERAIGLHLEVLLALP